MDTERFRKRLYRLMTVEKVKKIFKEDVIKYLDWEIEILCCGLTLTKQFVEVNKIKKNKNKMIKYILKQDHLTVQKSIIEHCFNNIKEEEK